MDVYDSTLEKLDKLGVSLPKKKLQKREMQTLLNETDQLNSTVSSMVMKKFHHEMIMRREKLAFLMDKVYYIRKHEKDVYSALADSGIVARKMTAAAEE